MSEFSKPAEDLSQSASDYVNMKIDDLKLRTAKGLSITVSRLLSMILVLSVASIVLMCLAFGGVLLLGDVIGGSYGLAALIVAAFFLIVLVVLWVVRKKLFLNSFVQLFINMFFEDDKDSKKEA